MIEDIVETSSDDGNDENVELDSDEELQEAFAAGLLQPGLNRVYEKTEKKYENDVQAMKQKLAELASEVGVKASWIERLDLISNKAALAPELALQEEEHAKKRKKELKQDLISSAKKKKDKAKAADVAEKLNIAEDPVHNDFKRELLFYRQAQAAVLEALPRLKSMEVPTKRPQDYFAQMAKSDEHMQKIRQKLVEKQVTAERIEKIRKLREMKKFGKKVQIEVQQKREKEKREMLQQVKKFRKGQVERIDFLDDDDDGSNKRKGKTNNNKTEMKTKFKNDKFGYGGKKRGLKRNTKSSTDDVSGFRHPKKMVGGKMKQFANKKRPGKARRQKMRAGKK